MPDLTILCLNIVFRSTLFKRDNVILITDVRPRQKTIMSTCLLYKHTSVLTVSIFDTLWYVTRMISQARVTQLHLCLIFLFSYTQSDEGLLQTEPVNVSVFYFKKIQVGFIFLLMTTQRDDSP